MATTPNQSGDRQKGGRPVTDWHLVIAAIGTVLGTLLPIKVMITSYTSALERRFDVIEREQYASSIVLEDLEETVDELENLCSVYVLKNSSSINP